MSIRLEKAEWLASAPARAVMSALQAEGGPDCARFVGGCVRNSLIGAPVDDVDIATQLTPGRVTAALERAQLKAVPTGIEHGTVTAVAERRPFEITTLRRDVETDGRRAVVAFTTDWAEDAARRDFRLNALYADQEGQVFDPTGGGVADALAGRIVFVGDPDQRIREDYLRILRFFRFSAWYGRGQPDAAALEACERLGEGIASLSAERVSKELLKLLAAPDPRASVRLMEAAGLLRRAAPSAENVGRFERLVGLDLAHALASDPLLRFGALLPDDPLVAGETAEALRLSNAQRDRLVLMLSPEPSITPTLEPRAARALIYRDGARAVADRLRLAWSAEPEASPPLALLTLTQDWKPPVLPVAGEDILRLGVSRGPKVGELLRRVEAAWIDSDFTAGRDELLGLLQEAS